MREIRYVLAVSIASLLGVVILLFSLLQTGRPPLGLALGALFLAYGVLRLYLGPAG